MNRQKFLSTVGLSFLGAALLAGKKKKEAGLLTDCDDPITPPVPEGPFYKDEKLNRSDIREAVKGTPIQYRFKVEDKHCNPIKGAIVDIWQCDANGHYSDYEVEHTARQTWLRGHQQTDQLGQCSFMSIFPGWYANRITHLHAKVHIENKTVITTNFFFPKEIEHEVYQSPLYPNGQNPIKVLEDIELRVDKDNKRHDTLVMRVTRDKNGSLVANYTIAVA